MARDNRARLMKASGTMSASGTRIVAPADVGFLPAGSAPIVGPGQVMLVPPAYVGPVTSDAPAFTGGPTGPGGWQGLVCVDGDVIKSQIPDPHDPFSPFSPAYLCVNGQWIRQWMPII